MLLVQGGLTEARAQPIAVPARTDCVTSAARYHGVNEVLLRAIAWQADADAGCD